MEILWEIWDLRQFSFQENVGDKQTFFSRNLWNQIIGSKSINHKSGKAHNKLLFDGGNTNSTWLKFAHVKWKIQHNSYYCNWAGTWKSYGLWPFCADCEWEVGLKVSGCKRVGLKHNSLACCSSTVNDCPSMSRLFNNSIEESVKQYKIVANCLMNLIVNFCRLWTF
jgi:hypothetical protein